MPLLKIKVEPFGDAFPCKKGTGAMRKFAVPDGKGGREIASVWGPDLGRLQAIKNGDEISVQTGDFFFIKDAA